MKSNPHLKEDVSDEVSTHESSYDAAVGLITLPKLQSLEMCEVEFDDAFYKGMAAASSHSQVCH